MGTWRNTIFGLILSILLAFTLIATGCGGGGGSGTSASGGSSGGGEAASTSGIALPSEVSAVSASSGDESPAASLSGSFRAISRAVSDLPADSDYNTTKTAKFVDEPTLEIFGIIETILKAVTQTNYDEEENVGTSADDATPYKAMVAWEDDYEGRTQKQLQEWIVKSFMTTESGQDVNVVHLWIDEGEEQVKVESKIYQAPTQDAEGNYLDYGIWQITANFTLTETGESSGSFFADASLDGSTTVLRMTDSFVGPEDFMGGEEIIITEETKAIMHKTATTGYGRAIIPDWEFCFDVDFGAGETSPCEGLTELTLPTHNVKYAYDADYLGIQVLAEDNETVEETIYEDRNDIVQMVYRYGLFDGTTGANVESSKSFGFPIRYTDSNDNQRFGYYGAWQGRHQLWAGPNDTIDSGVTVEKDAWGDEESVSYTTLTYQGSLTKRGLVDASLSQIQDIPVEIWLSDNFDLRFDSALGGWKKCTWEKAGETDEFGHEIWEESCNNTAFDLSALVIPEDNHRKWIDAGREVCESYDPRANCVFYNYTYDGTNFVTTEWSQGTETYGPNDWQDGDHLWVNIGGSTYITYTGIFGDGATGWVEKTMTEFDEQTWTPTFDENADIAFDFPRDREYYINNKGVNFVVRRIADADAAASYEAKMETQSVVRPDNLATVFPTGTDHFAMEWEPADSRSTFTFDSDAMLLTYKSAGDNAPTGATDGGTVTQGMWGLAAYDENGTRISDGQGNAFQFNWEYATDANPWGAITYLVKADDTIEYLDDPIMLDPIDLTTAGGDTLTFSLQFDGWMHGLPDMHWELEKNDFMMTEDLKSKVVNIPAGTEATDSVTDAAYLVKPLEVGVILFKENGVPTGAPDIGQANDVDLDSIPEAATVNIGTLPTGVQLKYVEGKSAL